MDNLITISIIVDIMMSSGMYAAQILSPSAHMLLYSSQNAHLIMEGIYQSARKISVMGIFVKPIERLRMDNLITILTIAEFMIFSVKRVDHNQVHGAHGLPGGNVQSLVAREFNKEPVLALEMVVREIPLIQNHAQLRVVMLHFNGWVREFAHQILGNILTVLDPVERQRPSVEGHAK